MNDNIYTLPTLDYDYGALDPYISADIMRLHHDKHHQAYVDNLNKTLASAPELADLSLVKLLSQSQGEALGSAIRNHGGGHYNHSLFWKTMKPGGGGEPVGELATLIADMYGDFQSFVDEFTTKSLSVFGSGWCWLMTDGSIATTTNQDTPMLSGSSEPILGLDVWEHAYYLDYKNKRDDYIKAWWNVIDWEYVANRLRTLQTDA